MTVIAAQIVRHAHSACQAQCVGRRGGATTAVRQAHMARSVDKLSKAPTFMRSWRKFRGLTQEGAAERVGVDRTTYGRVENGELPYNQNYLERLAHAYGCDVGDILSVDPLKPDAPRLVYNRLRQAPPELQARAIAVLDALLKEAS